MPNISDRLDAVIEKLDGMTSETVEKNLDTTIASKVDHISKQLDYISSGGSGEASNGVMTIMTELDHTESATDYYEMDKTFEEIYDFANNGGYVQLCFTPSWANDKKFARLNSILKTKAPDMESDNIVLRFEQIAAVNQGNLMLFLAKAESFENTNRIVEVEFITID